MKTKHTPGKWTKTIDDRIETTYPTDGQGNELLKGEDPTYFRTITICKIETRPLQNVLNEEQKANAKLIQNAPELLKALNNAIRFIKLCPLLKEDDRPTGLNKWEQLIEDTTSPNN
jgi:hypothetical protein